MKCDLCPSWDLNEVIVLRKFKFSKYAPKKTQKARRICFRCARDLFWHSLYNFGTSWRMIFLDNSIISKEKKAKLMVIHA